MNLRLFMICIMLAILTSNNVADADIIHDDFMSIHVIQGDGQTSPLIGNKVAVEAIMIGDFQGKDNLNGFYLQEEDSDIDGSEETSEGIFVCDQKIWAKKRISPRGINCRLSAG